VLQRLLASCGIRFTLRFRKAITIGGNRLQTPGALSAIRLAHPESDARVLDSDRRRRPWPGRRSKIKKGWKQEAAGALALSRNHSRRGALPGLTAADGDDEFQRWGNVEAPGSTAGSGGTRASANTSGPDFKPGFGPVKLWSLE